MFERGWIWKRRLCEEEYGRVQQRYAEKWAVLRGNYSRRLMSAFNDILRGGFGRHEYGQPIHIQWLSYEKSVRDLGKEIMDTIVEIIWIQTIPGTTVPWNGFDQAEKEASRWDLTSTPEH